MRAGTKGREEMTNKEIQTNRKMIFLKFLSAAEYFNVKLFRGNVSKLDSEMKTILKIAGFEEGTQVWCDIEARILNTGKGHPLHPADVCNRRSSQDHPALL
jgi:hypothetical protein